MLNRAELFGAHKRLICHDLNEALPLDNNSFDTVFSNTLYWVDNLEQLLKEIGRILKQNGNFYALVTSEHATKFFFKKRFNKEGQLWWEYLDRGRSQHIRYQKSVDEWEEMFIKAGLQVVSHKPYMTKRMVEIHELGLRAIHPVLAEMANSLDLQKRTEIKKKWVDYLLFLTIPMFKTGWITDPGDSPCAYYRLHLRRD